MTVVLDTNVLLISIGSLSKYRPIFDAFLDNKFRLAVTTEILLEYLEIMEQHFKPNSTKTLVALLARSPSTEMITIRYRWGLITVDPDDNKFVDCAISANAKYLVTNDKHFNVLQNITFPKVDVVSIDRFLEEILDM